jgi:hypothetical protein
VARSEVHAAESGGEQRRAVGEHNVARGALQREPGIAIAEHDARSYIARGSRRGKELAAVGGTAVKARERREHRAGH